MNHQCENPTCDSNAFSRGLCRACYCFAYRNSGQLPDKRRFETGQDEERLRVEMIKLRKLETAYENACSVQAMLRLKRWISLKAKAIEVMQQER